MELRLALSMLPREVRHDLWRTCEPRHGRAIDRAADAIRKRLEHGFTIEPKDLPSNSPFRPPALRYAGRPPMEGLGLGLVANHFDVVPRQVL